ncbi:hypothetical protein BHE74_00037647, partial [Ensete ventricosum]
KYSEMGDAKDDVDAEFQERGVNEADSDDEAYDQYDCKPTEKEGVFYDFRRNSRSVRSTILHFQVRKKW